jgi:hypothetical protein
MPQYYDLILFLGFFDQHNGGLFSKEFAKYGFSVDHPEKNIELQILAIWKIFLS